MCLDSPFSLKGGEMKNPVTAMLSAISMMLIIFFLFPEVQGYFFLRPEKIDCRGIDISALQFEVGARIILGNNYYIIRDGGLAEGPEGEINSTNEDWRGRDEITVWMHWDWSLVSRNEGNMWSWDFYSFHYQRTFRRPAHCS